MTCLKTLHLWLQSLFLKKSEIVGAHDLGIDILTEMEEQMPPETEGDGYICYACDYYHNTTTERFFEKCTHPRLKGYPFHLRKKSCKYWRGPFTK